MTLLRTLLKGGTERRDIFANSSIIPSVEHMDQTMSQESATRLITVFRCNQLLADTVSTLPVNALERDARGALVPTARPAWLDIPDPDDPSITRVEHFSQVMWSLGLDGNSFTLVLPNVYDPVALYVLDPTKVEVRRGPTYRIRMADLRTDVGPDQIIHIARSRKGSALRGLSPIDEAAGALGTQRAAARFGSRVFNNGVYMSGYMALPGPAAKEVTDQLKDEIVAQYGGVNQMKPGIFANGAKWEVPQISLEALQFLDLQKWGKHEIATLYGISPHLLGITEPGAMAYASVEAQGIDYEKFTVRPYIERIEAGYNRLVPGSTTYLRFDSRSLLRGDIKTRFEAYGSALDHKFFSIPEVRRFEDMPDQPDGPLLETPNNNPPLSPPQQRSVESEADSERRHQETLAGLAAVAAIEPRGVEIHQAPVTVHPADVNVDARSTVTTPEVKVDAPVTVHTPDVRVAPAKVNVEVQVPEQRPVKRTVERDAKGLITGTVEGPVDGE